MSTPEVPNECIDDRVEKIELTAEKLRETNESVSRAKALEELAEIEGKQPEVLLARMKDVTKALDTARAEGKPFMPEYTEMVRTEAVEYGADPSRYAGLRTKLDITPQYLS